MQERNINRLPLIPALSGDQSHNQELNQGPFPLWDNPQPSHTSQDSLQRSLERCVFPHRKYFISRNTF